MIFLARYPRRYLSSVIVLVVLAILTGSYASLAGADGSDCHPFRVGERWFYELRWGIIPAGYAELSVLPTTAVDGVPAWHFQLKIRTNKFVDVFYKVRDEINAYADLSLEEFMFYRKSQREGHTQREEVVSFDKIRRSAIYSNHGQAEAPVPLVPGTIDPLSAVFFVRSKLQREGLEIIKPITDGKTNVTGVARVVGRERLVLGNLTYDTFRVEPDLRGVGGVFEKSKDSRMWLWFTADDRRLLVKVEGKVVVGSFTGTLLDGDPGVEAVEDE